MRPIKSSCGATLLSFWFVQLLLLTMEWRPFALRIFEGQARQRVIVVVVNDHVFFCFPGAARFGLDQLLVRQVVDLAEACCVRLEVFILLLLELNCVDWIHLARRSRAVRAIRLRLDPSRKHLLAAPEIVEGPQAS